MKKYEGLNTEWKNNFYTAQILREINSYFITPKTDIFKDWINVWLQPTFYQNLFHVKSEQGYGKIPTLWKRFTKYYWIP